MTGSISLDIVIGLIFVYLLYSLFASIIAELISSIIALRARVLLQGITRMLEDEPEGKLGKTNRGLFDFFGALINEGIITFKNWIKPTKNYSTDRVYDHPLIKYTARNKLYSKPSYIDPSVFSKVILDLLKKGNTGTPLEKIKKGLQYNHKKSPQSDSHFLSDETCELLYGFLEDANFDVDKFQKKIEAWFNLTMERTKGWFKRKNRIILIVIGLVMAWQFNVSTFDVVEKLSTDKSSREQMVELAIAYTDENAELPIQATDSTPATNDELNEKVDELLSVKKELREDINSANNVLGFKAQDSIECISVNAPKDPNLAYRPLKDNADYLVGFPNAFIAKKTIDFYSIKESKPPTVKAGSPPTKYAYLDSKAYFWHQFFGYLVTALAISLGANFWFDLLNKLVKLRTSVQTATPSTAAASGKSQNEPVG